jgi:hypothetical protein
MSASRSTSSEKAIEEKIPWIPIILATILISAVGQLVVIYAGGMRSFYSLGVILCSIALSTSFYIYHMLIAAMTQLTGSKRLASKLTPENLIYIFIVGSCATWFISTTGFPWQAYGGFLGTRMVYPELSMEYFPLFVAPSPEVCNQLMRGGLPVPWGDWMPTILFWWLYLFSVGLFLTALATILRKDWIDVERVPFQQAMILHEFIRRMPIPEEPRRRISLSSPFSIGLMLGVIFNLPILLTYLLPWFPDIYAWRTNTCGHGAIMSLAGTPFWQLVGISQVNKHPLSVSVMYLAPLNILFNIWFWYFVYLILMQVAFFMGYYTGLENAPTGCCRTWGPVSVTFSPPYKWLAFGCGAMIGLTLFYILVKWRYIADTIRAAFGKYSEFEKGEVPYRIAWGLFIAASVIMIIQWMVAGMSFIPALLLPVSILFFWICESRVWGMTGTYIRASWHGHTLYSFLWPQAPQPLTPDIVMASYLSEFVSDCPENQNGGAIFSAFSAYKLAYLMNVDTRKVFKVLVVVQAIVPIIATITWLWTTYLVGAAKTGYGVYTYAAPVDRCANPANWNRIPAEPPWYDRFALGLISVGILSYLHARFIWFPFEPIGFLIAFSEANWFFGMWLPAVIAWVLKTITLKVGGSKLYEQYGIPIAAGFVIGFVAVSFIGAIIADYRFFFPF